MTDTEETLRNAVEANPGAPEFVELAKLVAEKEHGRPEAREICLRGLTADPKNALGRLLLAKLFYLDGMSLFAARELVELSRARRTPALERLLAAFADFTDGVSPTTGTTSPVGGSATEQEEQVVGELDLDADFDEIEVELDEDEDH